MSYDQSAPIYDAIYTAMKDYRLEAECLHNYIAQIKQSPGNRLLDVACGTGLHDQYLTARYQVEGIDLSEAQLAIARVRLPQMTFYHDNMVTFDIDARYDVVTCLFNAIGHLNEQEMPAAVANMARHLVPGGVLVVEPWLLPHMWQPGHVNMNAVDLLDLKIARVSRGTVDGNIIRLDLHHLVGRPEGVEHFVEHHDLTMFTAEQYLEAFRKAGLEAWHNTEGLSSNGRGLFIGRKPLA